MSACPDDITDVARVDRAAVLQAAVRDVEAQHQFRRGFHWRDTLAVNQAPNGFAGSTPALSTNASGPSWRGSLTVNQTVPGSNPGDAATLL